MAPSKNLELGVKVPKTCGLSRYTDVEDDAGATSTRPVWFTISAAAPVRELL
eukprot:CAMPEP_0180425508 /NCGR_PEP_ID=MMETSP1036_2-20121128/5300_1 /TAXON_ID=632150 /ORGANISM="Azadinium spinosum, Strain 3D9" /LENGTH=51 /DNA_ID=CAMNT_0022431001 /DNA_START=210 /DNA_END=365 /DNA_ORIENTATION=+